MSWKPSEWRPLVVGIVLATLAPFAWVQVGAWAGSTIALMAVLLAAAAWDW